MFIRLVQATAHSGTSLPVRNVLAHVKVSLGRPRTGELGPCWLTQPGAHTELLLRAKLWAGSTLSSQLSGGWPIYWGSFAKKPALQLYATLDAWCFMRTRVCLCSTEEQNELQGAEWQKSTEEWDQEDMGMGMGKEETSRLGQWFLCSTGNIL